MRELRYWHATRQPHGMRPVLYYIPQPVMHHRHYLRITYHHHSSQFPNFLPLDSFSTICHPLTPLQSLHFLLNIDTLPAELAPLASLAQLTYLLQALKTVSPD